MSVGNSSSPLLEVKTYFVFSFLFPFGLDLYLSLISSPGPGIKDAL